MAWALLVGIAAPWYIYAVARHGMAFVNGFLLHHNLQRFTGSLEGHAGSLFYYLEVLPAAMMPWTPLLIPIAIGLRTRWKEPVSRFMLLWLAFVLVFFSLSGTKLPHYVLYGFTPLMLLAAQELVAAKLPVRLSLCITITAVVGLGAASPWIAHQLSTSTHDPLYQALLSTAPPAPWIWMCVPLGLLVFALTIWVPNVRNYISESDGAVFAALLAAGWMVRRRAAVVGPDRAGSDPHAGAHRAHRADDAARRAARRAMAPAPAQHRVLPEPDGRARRPGQRRLGVDPRRPHQAGRARQAGGRAAGARLRARAAGAGGVRAAVAHRRRAERGAGGERGRLRAGVGGGRARTGRVGRRGRQRGRGRRRREGDAGRARVRARSRARAGPRRAPAKKSK